MKIEPLLQDVDKNHIKCVLMKNGELKAPRDVLNSKIRTPFK